MPTSASSTEPLARADALQALAGEVARADALQASTEPLARADALQALAGEVARADALQALADDVARRTEPLARSEAVDALAGALGSLAEDVVRRTDGLARTETVDALAVDVVRRADLEALADRLSGHVTGQLAERFADLPDSRGLAADLGSQLGALHDRTLDAGALESGLAPVLRRFDALPDRAFVVEALQALEERLGQRLESRVQALEERLLAAVARGQDERPDVVAVRSQVEGLEASVLDGLEGVVQGVASLAARLLDRLPEAGLLQRTAEGVQQLGRAQTELASRVEAGTTAAVPDGLADDVARRVSAEVQQVLAAQLQEQVAAAVQTELARTRSATEAVPMQDAPVRVAPVQEALQQPPAPEQPEPVEPPPAAPEPAPPAQPVRPPRPVRPAVDSGVAPRLPR